VTTGRRYQSNPERLPSSVTDREQGTYDEGYGPRCPHSSQRGCREWEVASDFVCVDILTSVVSEARANVREFDVLVGGLLGMGLDSRTVGRALRAVDRLTHDELWVLPDAPSPTQKRCHPHVVRFPCQL